MAQAVTGEQSHRTRGYTGSVTPPMPRATGVPSVTVIVAQALPTTVTLGTPVALGIGGVTDPVYPLVRCDCSPVTACAIRTRGIYRLVVNTTATGANIRVVSGLACAPRNTVPVIPVPAATPAP